jgi:hypothetical protein
LAIASPALVAKRLVLPDEPTDAIHRIAPIVPAAPEHLPHPGGFWSVDAYPRGTRLFAGALSVHGFYAPGSGAPLLSIDLQSMLTPRGNSRPPWWWETKALLDERDLVPMLIENMMFHHGRALAEKHGADFAAALKR